jgi:HTH-type transcriptional regulator/antitoxin HigA
MTIRPIRTGQDLADARAAIARLIALDPPAGSDEFDRLDVLATLVESYEARHRDGPPADPVDAIWEKMGEAGISQRLLAAITRIPEPELADVLARRRALGAAMMGVLGPALGLPLEVLMQPVRTVEPVGMVPPQA